MKIYRIKVVAQVFYFTELFSHSIQDAKDCAVDELFQRLKDEVDDFTLNWTEILSEREEEE